MPLNIFINEKAMNEEVTKSDDSIKLFNIMKIIAAEGSRNTEICKSTTADVLTM